MGETKKIETDMVHLARIALSGRSQDVQLFLHRIAKNYRDAAPELAAAMTDLLRESPTRSSPLRRQSEVALPVDVDTRFQLLRIEQRPTLDHELILDVEINRRLTRLVEERGSIDALFAAGLQPTKSAIFVGPPGVGKTMAARWVARALRRPLLILDLAAVMSSYLGRTGTNLRHVLDYAKTLDCVLLLDELDAIAKRRDDKSEIGELKRLVTVLIQEIDDWPSSGLLLAATNHSELLDPAIWRRFDVKIEFPLPDQVAIRAFVMSILDGKSVKAKEWAVIFGHALTGRSFSDIERELMSARRAAVVEQTSIDDQLVSIVHANALTKTDKIAMAAALVEGGFTSQRAAHTLTGVSRDTIRSRSTRAVATGSPRKRVLNAKT